VQRADAGEVLRRRLTAQLLVGRRPSSPTDVVRRLTCVQSQEYAHAFWSLGLRSTGSSYAEVKAAFDRGEFLRTHILRPTWHFVAAEDLGWITAVTAPRVQQLNGTMYRQLGLDQDRLDRTATTIIEALAGGRYRTRAELGRLVGASGTELAYLVMNAEVEGLIASGPMRGAQHTYAVLGERVTTPSTGDAAELAYRFYAGHGPASVRDLARWSSLTLAQATEATETAAPRLRAYAVAGETLWAGLAAADPGEPGYGALLLPLYDELTLTYPQLNFPLAAGHPHPRGDDLFVGSVIIGQANAGTWRRTARPRSVLVEIALAAGLDHQAEDQAADAAAELARFLGKPLELTIRIGEAG
jgi:hypothetical protein